MSTDEYYTSYERLRKRNRIIFGLMVATLVIASAFALLWQ